MLQGSTKVTGIDILHGWDSVWSRRYPHVPQSDLDERFKIDRALLFKQVISSLPRLEFLRFRFDGNINRRRLPFALTEFDSLPDVPSLLLSGWPFQRLGANSLQTKIRPTVLQKLRLFNVCDIDNLFEVLVRNDIQLKQLLVQWAWRQDLQIFPQHPVVNPWPELTTFLLQQRSIEELALSGCEMRTAPIFRCATQNGASLKSLQLHLHNRPPKRSYPQNLGEIEPSLDYGLLELIRVSCDVLETLRIDMPLEQLVAVSPAPFPRPQPKTHIPSIHVKYFK